MTKLIKASTQETKNNPIRDPIVQTVIIYNGVATQYSCASNFPLLSDVLFSCYKPNI